MSSEYPSVEDKVSYGIGRQMGDQLAANPFEGLNIEAVASGLTDALLAVESAVPVNELESAFAVIREKMEAQEKQMASQFAGEGEAFLAENAKNTGVITTESGLQYQIMKEGDGEKPSKSATVKTHYHGTLITGEVFDSSVDRGQPAEFPVGGVIAGWTEALQIMPVGSKWRLFVPSDLAYGDRGAGGQIGPHCALIFDVELLEIVG